MIFKDSLVYGVTMNLSIISAIILTPQYTRTLTMSDYGIMDIFNTWNSLITNFLPVGMLTIIMIIYDDLKTKEDKRKSLGTIFVYLIFISVLFSLIAYAAQDEFLETIIGKRTPIEQEIFLENVFIIIATMIFTFILTLLRSKFSKWQYVIVSIVQFLIISLLGYFLVVVLKTGFVGFYRASCLSFAASVAIGLYFIREELFLTFDKKRFGELFKISVHYLSVMMLMKLVEVLGRFLLKEYSSLEDIGIYSIGIRIASIVMFVLTSFTTAWYPYSMAIRNDADRDEKVNKTHQLFYIVSGIIAVFILVFRSELIWFFAPTYTKSYHVIPILMFSNIASATIYFYQLGVNYTRQTKFISIGGFCSVLVTGLTSLFLIKSYGAVGYATATLLGMLTWAGLQKYFGHKLVPIKFSYYVVYIFIATYLIACIIPAFIDPWLNEISLIWRIGYKFGLSVVILIPMFIFGYYKFKLDIHTLWDKYFPFGARKSL